MTTLLVILLCVSPVSVLIMIHNQYKLEKKLNDRFSTLDNNLDILKSSVKDCIGTSISIKDEISSI